MNPPARPCNARNAMSVPADGAKAQAAEARAKPANETRKTRRRP